jgi:hypothetical protein
VHSVRTEELRACCNVSWSSGTKTNFHNELCTHCKVQCVESGVKSDGIASATRKNSMPGVVGIIGQARLVRLDPTPHPRLAITWKQTGFSISSEPARLWGIGMS